MMVAGKTPWRFLGPCELPECRFCRPQCLVICIVSSAAVDLVGNTSKQACCLRRMTPNMPPTSWQGMPQEVTITPNFLSKCHCVSIRPDYAAYTYTLPAESDVVWMWDIIVRPAVCAPPAAGPVLPRQFPTKWAGSNAGTRDRPRPSCTFNRALYSAGNQPLRAPSYSSVFWPLDD